jgi:hypothetical protein
VLDSQRIRRTGGCPQRFTPDMGKRGGKLWGARAGLQRTWLPHCPSCTVTTDPGIEGKQRPWEGRWPVRGEVAPGDLKCEFGQRGGSDDFRPEKNDIRAAGSRHTQRHAPLALLDRHGHGVERLFVRLVCRARLKSGGGGFRGVRGVPRHGPSGAAERLLLERRWPQQSRPRARQPR